MNKEQQTMSDTEKQLIFGEINNIKFVTPHDGLYVFDAPNSKIARIWLEEEVSQVFRLKAGELVTFSHHCREYYSYSDISLMSDTELLPCPFCGGTDLIHIDNGVYCKNTTCEGGIDFGHFIGGNDRESQECKEAVAKAWNTRTSLKDEPKHFWKCDEDTKLVDCVDRANIPVYANTILKEELTEKAKILEWIHDEVIDGYDDIDEARQAIFNEYVKAVEAIKGSDK